MRHVILSAFLLVLVGGAAAAAEKAKTAAEAKGDEVFGRIVAAYMDGNWDDIEKAFPARPADMAKLNRAQRADVESVRQALGECRPAWWNTLKAGKKTSFQTAVWGKPLSIKYDPDAKGETKFTAGEAKVEMTLGAEGLSVDSPDEGEFGFLKGDLAGQRVWHNLGAASAVSNFPQKQLAVVGEKDNLRINLYIDFRGNLTVLYYGLPPIRRWGLHIFLAAYMPEFGKGDMAASRKAVAAMLLLEILKSPATYPSLPLPETLEAEGAEAKLAVHYKFMINRKSAWTIAEDKAFRAAVRVLALANEQKTLENGKVLLPGGFTYAMMPGEDAPFQAQRDKFIKTAFDKAKAAKK
ncbi:MAG: hypothetical protein NTX87_20405 [Planctomycetota bacterium]|nr:hypothetical protein [Planctomycetota bacterium]